MTGLLFGHQRRDPLLASRRDFLAHASRRECIFSLKDNRVSSYAEGYFAETFFFLVRLISRFIVPCFGATQVFLPAARSYWLAWPNMAEPDWLAQVAICLDFKDAHRGKNTL